MKKIKKKKSLTIRLKEMRLDRDKWRDFYNENWRRWSEVRHELNELKKNIPVKYYRVKYKINTNNKLLYEYNELIEALYPSHAIEKIKKDKTYPDSFILVDIQLLT